MPSTILSSKDTTGDFTASIAAVIFASVFGAIMLISFIAVVDWLIRNRHQFITPSPGFDDEVTWSITMWIKDKSLCTSVEHQPGDLLLKDNQQRPGRAYRCCNLGLLFASQRLMLRAVVIPRAIVNASTWNKGKCVNMVQTGTHCATARCRQKKVLAVKRPNRVLASARTMATLASKD